MTTDHEVGNDHRPQRCHRPSQDMTTYHDPGNDDRPTQDMITDYDIGNDQTQEMTTDTPRR